MAFYFCLSVCENLSLVLLTDQGQHVIGCNHVFIPAFIVNVNLVCRCARPCLRLKKFLMDFSKVFHGLGSGLRI